MNTGLATYGFAATTFFLCTIILLFSRGGNTTVRPLIVACIVTTIWAVAELFLTLYSTSFGIIGGFFDTLRVLSWASFAHWLTLQTNIADSVNTQLQKQHAKSSKYFKLTCIGIIFIQALATLLLVTNLISANITNSLLPIVWLICPLIGLYILERLYFSTPNNRRWAIRYLCVGLAAMFLYDFLIFSHVLLFKSIPLNIWHSRGAFFSLLAPVVGLSIARNPDWALHVHVSRQAVTNSATLLIAGIYLILTAFAASLIRFGNFEGTSVIQVTFVLGSTLLLVLLLLSHTMRARARVLISKHFFNFKYDYRQEWLQFTKTLACDSDQVPDSIVIGLSNVVESKGGELWHNDVNNGLTQSARIKRKEHELVSAPELNSLMEFLLETHWLVDLDEYRSNPQKYNNLKLPQSWNDNTSNWLIVPLPFQELIIGFVLINRSQILRSINWEDRDLLKTAGHQAAGVLAQRIAHTQLQEAGKFDAFSKLSAYVVHDLKNILGQQSLIVSNAAKHKHNPEFVDDVISTVDNSVQRMQTLLQQIREPQVELEETSIDMKTIIAQVISSSNKRRPAPELSVKNNSVVVASTDKLKRVFGHLVQNAQEATPNTGTVTITIDKNHSEAIVKITDTGSGMSQDFINQKLFTAFESTKGLTGMGVGVFESREYIQKLKGTITVESAIGKGTTFTICLPRI